MKHTSMFFIIATAMSGSACSGSVEPVCFSVDAPAGLDVAVGQPVSFVFCGNPDYITFFSGESGNDYAASDRYVADISGLELSCGIRQQYNDVEYLDRQLIYVYASTDFNGDYTPGSLNEATWIPLTGSGANCLPVPIAVSASAVSCSGSIDLGMYIARDKPFYIAFLYNAPGRPVIPAANGGGRYMVRPRIDVTGLAVIRTLSDGSRRYLDNASTQLGMRAIYEQSYEKSNFTVTDDGMLFQPVTAVVDPVSGREPDEKVWMVSAMIDPCKVEPDRGVSIKSIADRLDSYEYVYNNPGTYTATFVATNANIWDRRQSIEQLTVTVR